MAEKKILSLLEEEKLTEKIRSYPVLYDKSHKGYKERDAISNSWKEVADVLDFIENGKCEYKFSLGIQNVFFCHNHWDILFNLI